LQHDHPPTWLVFLDFCRATNLSNRFEACALDFSVRFGRSTSPAGRRRAENLARRSPLRYARGMRKLVQVLLLAAALTTPAVVALRSEEACASVAYDSPYTFEQTYGSALRLVRVDLGCKVTEKDSDNGYLLFDYTSPESGKQVHRGSVEVVKNHKGTHVSVQLPSLPRYHEQMIVDALVKKLLSEHGDPPRNRPAAPPPQDDGGAGDAQAPR